MRRLLVLVCAIVFIDTSFYAAITPLLPYYADHENLTKTSAGILAGAYPAGTLIASLPAGAPAARGGPGALPVRGAGGARWPSGAARCGYVAAGRDQRGLRPGPVDRPARPGALRTGHRRRV